MTRNCWAQGFSIESDFDEKWPNTGSTKSYSLEITNSTCNFDGQTRDCLLINGQYPGPKITADWGDKLSISVKNSLTNNGTGIHWHGVRQWHTPSQDGVPGITECPLAPGDTKVYNFQATQVCHPL
jgi:FtsP/CotA-like multicopper oxidase with cupredoxin domain